MQNLLDLTVYLILDSHYECQAKDQANPCIFARSPKNLALCIVPFVPFPSLRVIERPPTSKISGTYSTLSAPGFWFGGESRGNGSEGANAGGPGGEGPPDGSEVSFLKTIQSIRKWIHFSKISTFFLARKSIFFQRKNSKIGHISQEFLSFLEKYIEFWFFWRNCINPEKFPMNSIN